MTEVIGHGLSVPSSCVGAAPGCADLLEENTTDEESWLA
jgi:hypothetical protein